MKKILIVILISILILQPINTFAAIPDDEKPFKFNDDLEDKEIDVKNKRPYPRRGGNMGNPAVTVLTTAIGFTPMGQDLIDGTAQTLEDIDYWLWDKGKEYLPVVGDGIIRTGEELGDFISDVYAEIKLDDELGHFDLEVDLKNDLEEHLYLDVSNNLQSSAHEMKGLGSIFYISHRFSEGIRYTMGQFFLTYNHNVDKYNWRLEDRSTQWFYNSDTGKMEFRGTETTFHRSYKDRPSPSVLRRNSDYTKEEFYEIVRGAKNDVITSARNKEGYDIQKQMNKSGSRLNTNFPLEFPEIEPGSTVDQVGYTEIDGQPHILIEVPNPSFNPGIDNDPLSNPSHFPYYTPLFIPEGDPDPELIPGIIPNPNYPGVDPVPNPNPGEEPVPNPNPGEEPVPNPNPGEEPVPNPGPTDIIPPGGPPGPGEINFPKLTGALAGVTTVFPFSLPWDAGRAFDAIFSGFGSERPEWELPIKIPGKTEYIKVGIPDMVMSWVPFLHGLQIIIFDVGIIYAIRKWFGGTT